MSARRSSAGKPAGGKRAPRRANGRPAAAPRQRPARRRTSPARAAAELCREVLGAQGVGRAEVSLAFGDDEVLRSLNLRYRDIDRATDVLSFLYEERADRGVRELSGDLVISVPRLLEQARRYRVTPGRELARLVTHGALHLCGHDHVRPGERARMRAIERAHLGALTPERERDLTRLVRAWASRTA